MLILLALLAFSQAWEMERIPFCTFSDDPSVCPETSRIALGTLSIGRAHVEGKPDTTDPNYVASWMMAAYDLGITTIDLADQYPIKRSTDEERRNSVEVISEAFKILDGTPYAYENWFVNGKAGIQYIIEPLYIPDPNNSVEYLSGQLDWYLETLGRDYLDMFMIHLPAPNLRPDDVCAMFAEDEKSGRVKHHGVANFPAELFNDLDEACRKQGVYLITDQYQTSAMFPNGFTSLGNLSMQKKFSVFGWSALCGEPMGDPNLLFEDESLYRSQVRKKLFDQLTPIANEWGVEENVVALSWVLNPTANVIPLIGTTQIDRLQTVIANTFENVEKMTSDQWEDIASVVGVGGFNYENAYNTEDTSGSNERRQSSSGSDLGMQIVAGSWMEVFLFAFAILVIAYGGFKLYQREKEGIVPVSKAQAYGAVDTKADEEIGKL